MKPKMFIQKMKKTPSGKQYYRITKMVNSKKLCAMDQDYDASDIKQLMNSMEYNHYDFEINNPMPKGKR
jgi:hypothetical protein